MSATTVINEEAILKQYRDQFLGEDDKKIKGFDDEDINFSSDEEDTKQAEIKPKKAGLFSKLKSSIKNITGNKVKDILL